MNMDDLQKRIKELEQEVALKDAIIARQTKREEEKPTSVAPSVEPIDDGSFRPVTVSSRGLGSSAMSFSSTGTDSYRKQEASKEPEVTLTMVYATVMSLVPLVNKIPSIESSGTATNTMVKEMKSKLHDAMPTTFSAPSAESSIDRSNSSKSVIEAQYKPSHNYKDTSYEGYDGDVDDESRWEE